MTSTDPDPRGSPALTRVEVRRRASAGVFFIASSSLAGLVIGFAGNLILARLLVPSDFGMVAVGATVLLLGGALAEGGLGIGMIRRAEDPAPEELRALNGIQLAIALAIFVPCTLIALNFGTTGQVTAIMLLSLPITTLQTPGRVMLLRRMQYDRQAVVDLGAQASSLLFSVTTCLLGAGVWGLAVGSVVKGVAAVVLTAILSIGIHPPSFRGWRPLGPLMRFGLVFQANWIVLVARTQGLNAAIALVGGVDVLGLWWLANRLLDVPSVIFGSLSGVSFPAMANLIAHGEDPSPTIPRVVRLATIASVLVFVPFAVASPDLVPIVFGEQWRQAGEIIPLVTLGLLIGGPISVGVCGYLFAIGKPAAVAWGSALTGIAWITVTVAAFPLVGISAIGIGAICGGLVDAIYLDSVTRREVRITSIGSAAVPIAIALLAGLLGLGIVEATSSGLLIAAAAGVVAEAVCLAGLWLVCRSDLLETIRTTLGTVSDAVSRAPASSEPA
jgi:O-antigen/teichoic acid export membrane protein